MTGLPDAERGIEPVPLLEMLSSFVRSIAAGEDGADALGTFCRRVADVLGCFGAGIMLVDEHDDLRLAATSDERVHAVEQAQMASGEGPCITAWATGTPVQVDEDDLARRFPQFHEAAAALGLTTVRSFPLVLHGAPIGSMNYFWTRPVRGNGTIDEAAALLADLAAGYVATRREQDDSSVLVGNLRGALESRVAVEQAKGYVAGRTGMGLDDAFDALRRRARSERRKLGEFCVDVVEGRVDVDGLVETPAAEEAV